MYNYIFLISLFYSKVFSYTFDYRKSTDLNIIWKNNPNIEYSFDINEYCLSKCLKNNYIYITWNNSITDYYDYIQTAINTISINGGGSLYLENGIYILSNQIEIGSNTCILGESKENTIFKLQNLALPFSRSGLLRSLKQENITISDITLDGNKQYQNIDTISAYGRYGLYTEVNYYSFFNNVKIKNFQGYGFDPHGNKIDWGKYLVISECDSINNDYDGITIDQTDYVTLIYNNASDNYRHGINIVTGSHSGLIVNNNLYNNGINSLIGCGITIQNNFNFGTSDWTLLDNNIQNNSLEEICIRDSNNIEILSNTITNEKKLSDIYCIWMENNNNINISNNFCIASNFIRDKNNTNLVVKNNIFKNINIDSDNDIPDPFCDSGIINGLACCFDGCNTCGGINCSKDQYGSNFCCSSTILLSSRYCTEFSPPCIIQNDFSSAPTISPTILQTLTPTSKLTINPTAKPTTEPTTEPTTQPTIKQTLDPTIEPTTEPTIKQTIGPTIDSTIGPTIDSTIEPSLEPTLEPSLEPTLEPSVIPTVVPTVNPTLSNDASILHNSLQIITLFMTLIPFLLY
jgi:hypothetical protein